MEINNETGESKATGRILFTNPKNNPNEKMPTLAYRIIGGLAVGHDQRDGRIITSSYVEWSTDPVAITADAALAATSGGGRKNEAQTALRKFLYGLLAKGEPVPQKMIMEKGKQLGFSEKQIRTAARNLNVATGRVGGLADEGEWQWHLPL